MLSLIKQKAADKHGEMYIRACVIVLIISMVFSVMLFFFFAIVQVKAQRKSAYQILDKYTQANAIEILDSIKMSSDETEDLNPDAFIAQLAEGQNLTAEAGEWVAFNEEGGKRFSVSDIRLHFTVDNTTQLYATYTLTVPLQVLGYTAWVDVPLTITTDLRPMFDTEEEKLQVSVEAFQGQYDGNAHGITVTCTPNDATILYGHSDGNCTLLTSPTYTEPGTYLVFYEVTKTGCEPVKGAALVQILAVEDMVLDVVSQGWSGLEDGAAHSITVSCQQEGVQIYYGLSADNVSLTEAPTFNTPGLYTVYFRVEKEGYEPVSGVETVEIVAVNVPGA